MEEGRERPERESNFVFDAHSTSTVIYQGEERLRERKREGEIERETETEGGEKDLKEKKRDLYKLQCMDDGLQ